MTLCRYRLPSKRSSAATTLVARALLALLLVFYVNYVPFHLLTEQHVSDGFVWSHSDAVDLHDDEADHDHESDHQPHSASEHSIQMLAKSDSVAAFPLFVPSLALILIEAPTLSSTSSYVEYIRWPGESPPDPLQPRAAYAFVCLSVSQVESLVCRSFSSY
jgi:hypothetical protein